MLKACNLLHFSLRDCREVLSTFHSKINKVLQVEKTTYVVPLNRWLSYSLIYFRSSQLLSVCKIMGRIFMVKIDIPHTHEFFNEFPLKEKA
jgi:hypothetical protein